MNYLESPQIGSDKTAHGATAENIGSKVDMTDRNITTIFRRPSGQENDVLDGNHLKVSSPYSQDDVKDLVSANHSTGDLTASTKGDTTSNKQGLVQRCDTTDTTGAAGNATTTDAAGSSSTATGASNSDAFVQQLDQTDPTLATLLTDAQQQMSPAGAAQLEANVSANFNQNNGQFPTDSSLMNASIAQMDAQGISSADITNAQNSVDADVSNPNIGDAPVSTFTSSGSDSNGSSSNSGSSSSDSSGSSSCDNSGSSSCDNSGSSSCDNSGSSSGSDSSNPLQQDMSQLMQDLESGNFQQFLQDLINDLPTLLAASGAGSDTSGSSTDTGASSDAPATSSDGTAPSSPTTGGDTTPGTASTPGTAGDTTAGTPATPGTSGATATSLSTVPNATAQITDTLNTGGKESLGSGYFVQGQNGTPFLVTDDHVTADPGSVTATLANGETVPVTLAGTNAGNDLAAYTSPAFNGVSTLALDPNLVSSGSADAYVPLTQAGQGFYQGNLTGTALRGSLQITPDDSQEQSILSQANQSDTMIGFNAPLQAGSSGSPVMVDTAQGWQVAGMEDDGSGNSNFTTSSQDVQNFVSSLA